MNKRKIEDIKFNSIKKILKKPEEVEVVQTKPTYIKPPTISPSVKQPNPKKLLSKYDFLKRKSSTTLNNYRISQTPQFSGKKNPVRGIIILFFIISLIVGAVYLLSTKFLSAKVIIIPKNKVFEFKNQVFTARNNNNNISFELMIVSDIENKDIVLTSSLDASEKAKGEITLYNEYSKTPQKIIAGSFVSDEKGISYRTNTTVSIPGYTLDETKIISGQASVGITSFLPGENYNGSPSNFYINALKKTTKYNKIYGKLKTPLSGGIIGLIYMMDEEGKAILKSTDVSKLQDKLMRKLSAQVPEGYILYPNATRFLFDFNESIIAKNPNTKIEITGTMSALLLKENNLSDSIIDKLLPEINKKEMSILRIPSERTNF